MPSIRKIRRTGIVHDFRRLCASEDTSKGGETCVPDALGFERGAEGLHRHVIVAAAPAAHGLGHRIGEYWDTDGDEDLEWQWFAYDDRWRVVARFEDAAAVSSPFEQIYHQYAGLNGQGGSSYIDLVIARDQFDYTEESPVSNRDFVLQNWRADVVALAAADGDLRERVMYDAYGIPFGTHPTDLTLGATSGVSGYGMPDGVLNNDDYNYFLALYTASDWRADWNRDGTLDAADNTAFLADYGAATGSWGRGVLSNRSNILGYAGYIHEPATGAAGAGHGTLWHVRHRVLHSGLGRWVQRDPAGYADLWSIYEYVRGSPVLHHDRSGQKACIAAGESGGCGEQPPPTPPPTNVAPPAGPTSPAPAPPTPCEQYQQFCRDTYTFPHGPAYTGLKYVFPFIPNYCAVWEAARIVEKYGASAPFIQLAMAQCARLALTADDDVWGPNQPGWPSPQNNVRHCTLACCLAEQLGRTIAIDILHAHECCSWHVGKSSCFDWNEDWHANLHGLACSSDCILSNETDPQTGKRPWERCEDCCKGQIVCD